MSRLKKLTLCDMAQRIYVDEQLKKQLVDAVAPLMPDETTPELKRRVLAAIDSSLLRALDPSALGTTVYKVTCAGCELNTIIQAKDWAKAGVSIECCVCGTQAMMPLPEKAEVFPCKVCGVETTIRRIVD